MAIFICNSCTLIHFSLISISNDCNSHTKHKLIVLEGWMYQFIISKSYIKPTPYIFWHMHCLHQSKTLSLSQMFRRWKILSCISQMSSHILCWQIYQEICLFIIVYTKFYISPIYMSYLGEKRYWFCREDNIQGLWLILIIP